MMFQCIGNYIPTSNETLKFCLSVYRLQSIFQKYYVIESWQFIKIASIKSKSFHTEFSYQNSPQMN